MVRFYRQALNAWGRRDDSVLQPTEVAEVLQARRWRRPDQDCPGIVAGRD
jgi:hypothetical protein